MIKNAYVRQKRDGAMESGRGGVQRKRDSGGRRKGLGGEEEVEEKGTAATGVCEIEKLILKLNSNTSCWLTEVNIWHYGGGNKEAIYFNCIIFT